MMSNAEFAKRFTDSLRALDEEDREYSFSIRTGHTGKPRASSLGGCARKQLYAMRGTPKTEILDPPWAPMMGHAGEAIVRQVLIHMGYVVQTAMLPDNLPFSGHIDDQLHGLDLDVPTLWDNKVRGVYGARMLVTKGLPAADTEMYLQMQAYMLALGLKQCMLTIEPHDLSLMKREVKSYKMDVASPLVFRIMIEADKAAQDVAMARATELAAAKALDLMVHREYNNASSSFPCGWCEWRTQCVVDDTIEEQTTLTTVPAEWTELDLEG